MTLGTIRKGEQKDIPQIKQIWEACFTTDQEYLQLVFTSLFPLSTPYIYEENGKVLSTLLLIPIILKSNTHPPLIGKYLYGVGTLPEARGKKLSIRMVETASKQMKEAGIDFIIARPAGDSLFPFYREQGFTIDVPRGTFTQPTSFHAAVQDYFKLISPATKEEKSFKTNPEPEIAAEKLHQTADSLFNYLAQTHPHRFEWPIEILQHMIRIGEFSLFPTESSPIHTPPNPFALTKPLSPVPPQWFQEAFFNFPME